MVFSLANSGDAVWLAFQQFFRRNMIILFKEFGDYDKKAVSIR